MEEKFIRNISIVCSVVGLVLLFFISRNVDLSQTGIGKITTDDVGKNVKVCGEIASKSVSKTQHVFLKLTDDTGSIDIVVFNSSAGNFDAYNIEKDDKVCITGQVNEYQDMLEIIPKEKIERDG